MAVINEAGLTYWEEKELELAMKILPHAAGWGNVTPEFDPVEYSLYMAKRLISGFMKEKEVPLEEYDNSWDTVKSE